MKRGITSATRDGKLQRKKKNQLNTSPESAHVPIVVIPTPTMFTGVMSSPKDHAASDIVVTS
jgi:hypothetical protein